MAGNFIGSATPYPLTSFCIGLAGPAIGKSIDDVIKDTKYDKVVQKGLGLESKFEAVLAPIQLPILVAICESNPALTPRFQSSIFEALDDVICANAEAIEFKKARKKSVKDAITKLKENSSPDSVWGTDDPKMAIYQSLIQSLMGTEIVEESPAENAPE